MSAYHRALDESDLALVALVRKTPSLYNHDTVSFRYVEQKNEDWANVAQQLNINENLARRRWKILRDRYARELRQMHLHPEENYGNNDFFRLMDFLRKFVRKRKSHRRHHSRSSCSSSFEMKNTNILYDEDATTNDDTYEDTRFTFDTDKTKDVKPTNDEYKSFMDDNVTGYEEYVAELIDPIYTQTEESHTIEADDNNIDESIERKSQKLSKPHRKSISATRMLNQRLRVQTEDDYFCKSISGYLKQLKRRHKIKAKIEIFQILEKYIEIEENEEQT